MTLGDEELKHHVSRNGSPVAQCLTRDLGPNNHGLVTYIQVNVYVGNMLSWLNRGVAFKTDVC